MLANVLLIVFLSIFVLTALLTLASLPGWITIPDKYRSQLFKALLLEVVGAIIILFSSEILNKKEQTFELNDMSKSKNWIAWDLDEGKFFQPTIVLNEKLSDGTYNTLETSTFGLDTRTAKELILNQKLSIKYIDEDEIYQIQKDSMHSFGKILKKNLKASSFFNKLNKISLENLSRLDLVKDTTTYSTWKITRALDKEKFPFSIEVVDTSIGTIYKILQYDLNTGKLILKYTSAIDPSIIDRGNSKPIHFYKVGYNYYLIYLSTIDNIGKDKYGNRKKKKFQFTVLKLEPDIK